ncbi:MAG: hypothetical protein IT377_00430 [Polyangiaceae bacterium]|nr:hypothetical protein [Polyangiaceae bacterium]
MRRLGSLLLLLALAGRAVADEKPSLIVSVDAGSSGVSADAVRSAIGKELGVATVAQGDGESRLSVRIQGDRATVVFTRGTEKIERVVDLPKEPAARVEVIALLAGNLARDEAGALLAALAPKPAEPEPAPPAPPPAEAPPASKPAPPPTVRAEAKPVAPAPAASESRSRRGPLFANLSLYSPIAITPDAEQRSFDIELGLAYSKIGGLTGFGLTVGHLRVGGPAAGVAVSGLWTRVDGDQKGAFVSGIFSQGGGSLRGAEGSGILTLRDGDLEGFQGSGVFGSARDVHGAQLAGIAAWSEGAVEGFQGAGALARARGSVQGAQISAVNIGGDLRGAQVGLVNIGESVRGTQIGVVNVADRVDGLPLGLVNVVKHGRTQALAWADTQVVANAAVKYLNGPVYTLIGAGYDGGDGAAAAFALGGHVQLSRATYFEVDVLYRYLTDFRDTDRDPDRHLTAGRVVLGADGLGPAGAFVGGGVSHDVDSHGEGAKVRGYGLAGVSLF